MNRVALVAVPLAFLLLAGCTAAPASDASDASSDSFAAVDRTGDLAEVLVETASYVEKATETEPGRLVIETKIVDPRGDDNSVEAATTVAICNAAVSLGGIDHVSVMEADGTSFVLFGHPSVPEGTCTEV
ncbi:MAG: hypothetical protein JWR57_1051 [Mycetocola sp.]|nr:hypothetical protein [Mycetocola sp.]